jgi:hypothetical protein
MHERADQARQTSLERGVTERVRVARGSCKFDIQLRAALRPTPSKRRVVQQKLAQQLKYGSGAILM